MNVDDQTALRAVLQPDLKERFGAMFKKTCLAVLVAATTASGALAPERVVAQSVSPENIAAFKALPADQRKALLQQYAPQIAAAGVDIPTDDGSAPATLGDADTGVSGVPEGNGPTQNAGPQAPAGSTPVVTATTLQAGDSVFIEIAHKGNLEPGDAATQEFLDAIDNRNPYEVKSDGALHLPGVPAVRVAGLPLASAERILGSRPQFTGWTLHLTVLPTVGGTPKRVAPFGHDFFQHGSGRQGLMPSLPVPKDYVLGPDDQIQIELFGAKAARYQRSIDRDGVLNVPEFGPVAVMGRRFDDVRQELEQQAKTRLVGTEIHVTMGRLRSMQVFVLGDVEHPGAYTVSSLSTVLNALMDSGGPNAVGSMRSIQLKRAGEKPRNVDLYDVLLAGDRTNDYSLQAGDVLFVPPVGKTAEIEGEVKRPAVYELTGNASLADLIKLAGGLNATAFSGEITVDRVTREGIREALHVDLAKGQANTLRINDGDRLQIARALDQFENTIELSGWVKRPRTIPWHESARVSELVPSLDALEHNPDLEYGLIAREVGQEKRLTFLRFVPREVWAHKGTDADPALQLHDVVLFFAKDESRTGLLEPLMRRLREEYRDGQVPPTVSISGPVKLGGTYPLSNGMTLKDLLIAAGGEREPDLTYAVLAREEGADRKLTVQSLSPQALLAGDPAVAGLRLQPRDAVVLFSKASPREGALKGYLERLVQESREGAPPAIVSVNGPVAFPGEYPLTAGMTVGDLITAAGGKREAITTTAELAHFEIRNHEARVSRIDTVRLNDEAALALPLNAHDVLTVRPVEHADTKQWVVKIDGAVRFPGAYVLKEHETLVQLMRRAGGFSDDANPEGLALVREEARINEQAQIDLMVDRLGHELAVKSIEVSNTPTTANTADTSAKEQMLAANALLAQLKAQKAVGRVALPADGIAQLHGGERYDLPLLGGDTILVPRRAGTVTVIGEVLSPGAFSVSAGRSLHEFIDLAGGTTKDADTGRAYVVGPDGLAQPISRLSSRGLRDGDTIIVPTDLKKLPPLPMWASVTQILSNMAVSVAALKTIKAL
jgi:polysaccharide export outer membrane protein